MNPRLEDNSESHLRSILATVPDAMVVIDERGHILSFSAAAEKLFGYAEREIVGENVAILMPSPDRERHDRYLANYARTGNRKMIGIGRVTTARHRNGSTFPIELSVGEAIIDERRVFTGFIHDITHRQQTEMRLQDLQAELAHVGRISEMGSLASSLAHELNQPLTAIANYSEAARDLFSGKMDEETRLLIQEALDETAKEAIRAGQIVARLRQFISQGETERRAESLSRLIGEANALALVGSREHGIEVQIQLDQGADLIFVDRVQIQQVLINLIRNAIDAMLASVSKSLTIRSDEDIARTILVHEVMHRADSWTKEIFWSLVQGYTLEELAEIKQAKANVIRSRLSKSLSRIRKQIEKETRAVEQRIAQRRRLTTAIGSFGNR